MRGIELRSVKGVHAKIMDTSDFLCRNNSLCKGAEFEENMTLGDDTCCWAMLDIKQRVEFVGRLTKTCHTRLVT